MTLLVAGSALLLALLCLLWLWRDSENQLHEIRRRQARQRAVQWRHRWGDDD